MLKRRRGSGSRDQAASAVRVGADDVVGASSWGAKPGRSGALRREFGVTGGSAGNLRAVTSSRSRVNDGLYSAGIGASDVEKCFEHPRRRGTVAEPADLRAPAQLPAASRRPRSNAINVAGVRHDARSTPVSRVTDLGRARLGRPLVMNMTRIGAGRRFPVPLRLSSCGRARLRAAQMRLQVRVIGRSRRQVSGPSSRPRCLAARESRRGRAEEGPHRCVRSPACGSRSDRPSREPRTTR